MPCIQNMGKGGTQLCWSEKCNIGLYFESFEVCHTKLNYHKVIITTVQTFLSKKKSTSKISVLNFIHVYEIKFSKQSYKLVQQFSQEVMNLFHIRPLSF
jgi:hypothetical protein